MENQCRPRRRQVWLIGWLIDDFQVEIDKAGVLRQFVEHGIEYVAEPNIIVGHEEGQTNTQGINRALNITDDQYGALQDKLSQLSWEFPLGDGVNAQHGALQLTNGEVGVSEKVWTRVSQIIDKMEIADKAGAMDQSSTNQSMINDQSSIILIYTYV